MRLFCIIALWFTGAFAGFSVLALPIWLLGVPGVDNSYARGWKSGLFVVMLYPLLWSCLFMFWRSERKHVTLADDSTLSLSIGSGSLVLFVIAASVLFRSFRSM